jgi:hypothetical protein
MPLHVQVSVVSRFKNDPDCNILFATTVAEEGLDIADCKLVVLFDRPLTATALTQRHGRARSDNSLAVFLAARGSPEGDQDITALLELIHKLPVYASGDEIPDAVVMDLRGKRMGEKIMASDVDLGEGISLVRRRALGWHARWRAETSR